MCEDINAVWAKYPVLILANAMQVHRCRQICLSRATIWLSMQACGCIVASVHACHSTAQHINPCAHTNAHKLTADHCRQAPHIFLNNPHFGSRLRKSLLDLPVFFLSHFFWSGVQHSTAVVVSLPRPMPWDGLRSFDAMSKDFSAIGARVVGFHVRTGAAQVSKNSHSVGTSCVMAMDANGGGACGCCVLVCDGRCTRFICK